MAARAHGEKRCYISEDIYRIQTNGKLLVFQGHKQSSIIIEVPEVGNTYTIQKLQRNSLNRRWVKEEGCFQLSFEG